MKEEQVTATKKIDGTEYAASVPFQVPESCDEMKENWGDAVAVSNAAANARVGLQAAIRRRIEKTVKEATEAGTTPKVDESAIANELAGYKPGEAAPKKDPIESYSASSSHSRKRSRPTCSSSLRQKLPASNTIYLLVERAGIFLALFYY